MPSRDFGVPIEALRQAARERVEATSLRTAAAEIGMSFRGLEGFVKGSFPHPATVRKLTDWYVKRVASEESAVSPDVAQAALSILIQHLPAAGRSEAEEQVVQLLNGLTTAKELPLPRWLSGKLRHQ
jgi:hypothetical protein